MFFSPTTARSLPVRSLYAGIYALLTLGAITMVVPFLIMITGSVEPRSDAGSFQLFPTYVVDDEALWERYVETKYHGVTDTFRMAWNQPGAMFLRSGPALNEPADPAQIELWERFLNEARPPDSLFALGFQRPGTRMPAYSALVFRDWLMEKYGSFEAINTALDTTFESITRVQPPQFRMDGSPIPDTQLVRAFRAFSETQPQDRKFAWDVGGYYRTSILPRLMGNDVATYNEKFGTSYQSYAEVPFPATVPEIGADPWFFFVSSMLRTDFVQLTPRGTERMLASGLRKDEFVRTTAEAPDLNVVSADILFADWAALQGIANAHIPQRALDQAAFTQEKGFWRFQFLTLNYRVVIDEIAGQGGAIRNTLILVVLSVGGALLINPLAAYALSRYKLRSSYHILLFCLATIAFPAEVTMIPVFLQLKEFNLLNTFGALVLPGLANGFSIFLLKGFFDSLPRELYEAAELDGASEFTTFWSVTMNLSKPILAVIALQAFVTAYGTFFYALILAPDPKMWTLMVYIFQLRQTVDAPVVYASLIVTAIPTLLVFVTCQNIILRGIVVPSDK